MIYHLLAAFVLAFHLTFVGFVVVGGLLVIFWRWVLWLHLPAVAWVIYIELSHGTCPLTPLENHFRLLGGQAGYQGGFIEHYIRPVLYPHGLTNAMQVGIALAVIVINLTCYTVALKRHRRLAIEQDNGEAATVISDPLEVED